MRGDDREPADGHRGLRGRRDRLLHRRLRHTGFIQVRTQTTGEASTNGYFLDVDGANAPVIGANATATLAVDGGQHAVTISDIADNCTAQGAGATQDVTVTGGETAHVTFTVACTALP